MRWPSSTSWRQRCAPTRRSWSASPGVATRTSTRWPHSTTSPFSGSPAASPPMSRITPRLAALKAQRRTALIPYLTAGDPDLGTTLALMHTAVAAGADILEIGVPFSDPCADGPVIQAASERALCQGVRLVDVLALVSQFRASDDETPVVLM